MFLTLNLNDLADVSPKMIIYELDIRGGEVGNRERGGVGSGGCICSDLEFVK